MGGEGGLRAGVWGGRLGATAAVLVGDTIGAGAGVGTETVIGIGTRTGAGIVTGTGGRGGVTAARRGGVRARDCTSGCDTESTRRRFGGFSAGGSLIRSNNAGFIATFMDVEAPSYVGRYELS